MSQTNGTILIENFTVNFKQVLGKGTSGCVYKGFHNITHEPIAVKAIQMSKVDNQVTKYLLDCQKAALNKIKNPYVVKTYDIVQQKDYCYITMELCSNGTLKDYIQRKGKLDPTEAIDIFSKIVAGYISVIDQLFIHRDLKTANILLRSNGDPVIIDFGYCQMIMGKRPLIQYNVGSPSYMSPEAHGKHRYSQKSDVWSLGVILHEMLTGKTLDSSDSYSGMDIKQFFNRVQNEKIIQLNLTEFNPVCTQLLQQSLQYSTDNRATAHRLKHIIDKSLIPVIQAKLNRTQSQKINPTSQQAVKLTLPTNTPSTQNTLMHTPPLPPSSRNISQPLINVEQKHNQRKNRKQQIKQHLNFLRSSDKFLLDSHKQLVSSTHPTGSVGNLSISSQQRNHQSTIQYQSVQNVHPQHPVFRKSLQRGDKPQVISSESISFKKATSLNEVQSKPSFKKFHVMQKTISLPPNTQHYMMPPPQIARPNRENYNGSLRVI